MKLRWVVPYETNRNLTKPWMFLLQHFGLHVRCPSLSYFNQNENVLGKILLVLPSVIFHENLCSSSQVVTRKQVDGQTWQS